MSESLPGSSARPSMLPVEWRHVLESGGGLITANQRLARNLTELYDAHQVQAGLSVWPSARVVTWSVWIRQCWEEAIEHGAGELPALMDAEQEQGLWQQIIAADAPGLLRADDAARSARSAWAVLHGWRLAPRDLTPQRLEGRALSQDVRRFKLWGEAFEQATSDHGWIDEARAVLALIDRAGLRRLVDWLPPLRVVGFDTLNPAQQHLLAALQADGLDCLAAGPVQVAEVLSARHQVCADPETEIIEAASWARACLSTGTLPARAHIGIVVPDLSSRRTAVKRQLSQVLEPEARRPAGLGRSAAFELSLGPPLAEVGSCADALALLSLVYSQLERASLGALVHSPYLGMGAAPTSERAGLERLLRESPQPALRLDEVISLLARRKGRDGADANAGASTPSDVSLAFFRGLSRFRTDAPASQPLGDWAQRFTATLRQAAWPGQRGLDTQEYQAVQATGELFSDVARLSTFKGAVSAQAALAEFRQQAMGRVFQPRGAGGWVNLEVEAAGEGGTGETRSARIEVVGLLESAGLCFDALWVCGMDAETWPSPPQLNPFLPPALQREQRMPRSSFEHERELAAIMLTRLRQSAPHLVFSHAATRDGEPCEPAALLASIPQLSEATGGVPGDPPAWCHPWRRVRDGAAGRITVIDDRGPGLDGTTPVRGGARAFLDQSQCPFRAFAIHRLGSASVKAPENMLDARVRGQILHRALDNLWERLGTHERLTGFDESEVAPLIRDAVSAALRQEAGPAARPERRQLWRLEQRRLERLLGAWLELERRRQAFAVDALETTREATVGGVRLRLRPDRVDRLEDGSVLLLDYKSGNNRISAWQGERPEDPQLPVYALALAGQGEAIQGVSFALLARERLGFAGLARTPDLAPGIAQVGVGARTPAPDWEALWGEWEQVVDALGAELTDGWASVAPAKGAATCRYCEQASLCRVGRLALNETDDEAAPGKEADG